MSETKNQDDGKLIVDFVFNEDGNEKKWSLDLTNLSTRQQVDVERVLNQPYDTAFANGWLLGSATGMAALAWVARKVDEPTYTFEEALDDVDHVENPEDQPEGGAPPTETPSMTGSPTSPSTE